MDDGRPHLKLAQLCSCCLAENCYKDLKSEYIWMGQREVYQEMLQYAFDITIDQQTTQVICDNCIIRLRDAANFKSQVVESQKNFDQYLHSVINSPETYIQEDNDVHTPRARKRKREIRDDCSNEGDIDEGSQMKNTQEDDIEIEKLKILKSNTLRLLKHTNVTVFRWQRNKYKCFCCLECFENFEELKKHSPAHTYAEIKRGILKTKALIYYKIEVSHITCNICMTSIQNYSEIANHLLSHGISVEKNLLIPFSLQDCMKCVVCHDKFDHFHALNVHMNTHYSNYICELCGNGFISKSNLKEHVERHNRVFKCQKCNLTFATDYQKDCHSKKIHNVAEKRVCPHCPERFGSHYSRLLHLINAHNYKKPEYKCSYCERTFLRQFLVNSHIRKFHKKERNYECTICQQKFFGLFDMKQHAATHSGERRYTCELCGKAYSRKWTLNDHMKIHAKDKDSHKLQSPTR